MNPTHAMDVILLQREIDDLRTRVAESSTRIQYVPIPVPTRPPVMFPRGLAILMLLAVGVIVFWPSLKSATNILPGNVRMMPDVGRLFSDVDRSLKVLKEEKQLRDHTCPVKPPTQNGDIHSSPTP